MTAIDFAAFVDELAAVSGEALRPFFRTTLGIENKSISGGFDPVTAADRAAEMAMRALIKRTFPGRRRRHAPDYFARCRDGTVVIVDIRADDRIEADDAAAFTATELACRSVGWRYRRVGVVEPVLAGNLRWLAGYRHPRNRVEPHAVALVSAFGQGCSLVEGAGSVGDPIAVLPTLYHLLWSGELVADLTTRLGGGTSVMARRRV